MSYENSASSNVAGRSILAVLARMGIFRSSIAANPVVAQIRPSLKPTKGGASAPPNNREKNRLAYLILRIVELR
jgi:hypothetical protein